MGTTASPFCAEFTSRMQQRVPFAIISYLVAQGVSLRKLQHTGTICHYPCACDLSSTPDPYNRTTHHPCALEFSDAGRQADRSQLSYVAGIFVGEISTDAPFRLLSSSSHKSQRLVCAIGAAEILATGEAIDEGKTLARTPSSIYASRIPLIMALNTRDPFTSL